MNITVKRANVVLTVPDYQKDEYKAKGFDVINKDGSVVEHAVPHDIPSLQRECSQLLDKVRQLQNENAELNAKIKKLTAKPKTTRQTKKSE